MAFTGVAVVTSLGKNTVRITGLSLAALATGTIGFSGDAGADVQLPATFPSDETACGAINGLALSDVIRIFLVNDGAGSGSRNIHVQKQVGPPFRIAITNSNGGTATADQEIWVECIHTLIR